MQDILFWHNDAPAACPLTSFLGPCQLGMRLQTVLPAVLLPGITYKSAVTFHTCQKFDNVHNMNSSYSTDTNFVKLSMLVYYRPCTQRYGQHKVVNLHHV